MYISILYRVECRCQPQAGINMYCTSSTGDLQGQSVVQVHALCRVTNAAASGLLRRRCCCCCC